jgi:hypothetical protein
VFLDFLAAEIGKQRKIVEGATADSGVATPQR